MTAPWQDVRCASIPEEALSALADLRDEPGIRVTIVGGRAWVFWDDGPASEATRRIVVDRLLPLSGVEIFSRRDGRWHRAGERLPAFELPADAGGAGVPLGRVVLPGPLAIVAPGGEPPRPVKLHLVRDDREIARPAAAMRCRLGPLAEWAELAPSAWIASLQGAWCGPDGGGADEAEVLVIGPVGVDARTKPKPPAIVGLPAIAGALRYWGEGVLIPMGFRAEPELGERALRDAVGADRDDIVALDEVGPELIPRRAFRPLSRASIRMAFAGAPRAASGGGPP